MKKQNLSLSANSTSSTTRAFNSMEDIRARLSYNSARSPVVIRSSYSKLSPPNKRLCDYHMSKQDPAVLDQMFNGKSPDFDIYKPVTMNKSVMGVASPPLGDSFSLPTAGMRTRPGVWHRTNTPPSVNTGNHSSLVQIAASRRNGVGQGSSRVGNYISPVLVKMASMDKKNRFGRLSPNVLTDSSNSETMDSSEKPSSPDPCDKDVVVSALKEKRKRWWSAVSSSSTMNGTSPLIKEYSQPKKPRIAPFASTVEDSIVNGSPMMSSTTVKRPLPSEPSLQPSKKIKHTTLDLLSQKRYPKRLILLDTDVEVSPLPSPVLLGDRKRKDSPAVIDDEERINEDSENIKRRRESSTPVVEEEEEQEVERKLKLKREATLKLKDSLSKVFPSPSRGGEDGPVRKKVPILCTTGSKPHVFSRSNHSESITHEAVKKDQEAVSNRVKSLLMSDDIDEEQPVQSSLLISSTSVSVSTTSAVSVQSSASLPGSLLSAAPTLSITSTASLLSSSLNSSSQLPTVQLTSSTLSATSNQPQAALGSLSNPPSLTMPSLNLPKSSTASLALSTSQLPSLPSSISQPPSLGATSASSGLSLGLLRSVASSSVSVAPTVVTSTISNPILASGSVPQLSSSKAPSSMAASNQILSGLSNVGSASNTQPQAVLSLGSSQGGVALTITSSQSSSNLFSFGGQQPSASQQPSLLGGQQPSLTSGQQPSLTGQQPSLLGGQRPSLTSGQQPSLIGGQQPSLLGGQQPTLTSGQQPSLTGQQPSLLGGQQPSLTSGQQPSLTGQQQSSFNSTQTAVPQGSLLNNSSLSQLSTSNNRTSLFSFGKNTSVQPPTSVTSQPSANTSTSALPMFNFAAPPSSSSTQPSSTSSGSSFNFSLGKNSTFRTNQAAQLSSSFSGALLSQQNNPQTITTGGLGMGKFNFGTSQSQGGMSSKFGSSQSNPSQQQALTASQGGMSSIFGSGQSNPSLQQQASQGGMSSIFGSGQSNPSQQQAPTTSQGGMSSIFGSGQSNPSLQQQPSQGGMSSIFGSGQSNPSQQQVPTTSTQSTTSFIFGGNQQQPQANTFQFSAGQASSGPINNNNKQPQNQSTVFSGFGNQKPGLGMGTSSTTAFNFGQNPTSSATPSFSLSAKPAAATSTAGFNFGKSGTAATPTFNFGQQPQASAPSLTGMTQNNPLSFPFGNTQNTQNQNPFGNLTQQQSTSQNPLNNSSKSGNLFSNNSTQQTTPFQFQSTGMGGASNQQSFNFSGNSSVGFATGATSKQRLAARRKTKK